MIYIRKKTLTTCYTVDVEISGLSSGHGDRVIEYAAVKIHQGEIVAELNNLIDIPCRILPGAQRVYGISRDMLHNQTAPDEAWPELLEFIGRAPLIARFIFNFLNNELSLLGKLLTNINICTLHQVHRRYPRLPNHRLETVAQHVQGTILEDCRLHRNQGDAHLVARLWIAM